MALSSYNNKPVQLHIMHSWGGGVERWVHDYCCADKKRTNLVLKSLGSPGTPVQKIGLYQNILDEELIQIWELTPYIYDTAIAHLEYNYILEEIIKTYQVSTILISSLIGHSLDALNTGLKTIFICHDYYPFCPAFFIYFKKICSHCTTQDLKECFQSNPYNYFFPMSSPEKWEKIRHYFSQLILQNEIPIVSPSQSVQKNLSFLDKKLHLGLFYLISHGIKPFRKIITIPPKYDSQDKLKILALGRIARHKGLDLFQEIAPEIVDIAEIFLLGYGEEGVELADLSSIQTIAQVYNREDLPEIVKKINPDLGLLLSVVPETFSYTLSELKMMGIPTITTNVGSFPERIIDQINGFLVPPDSHAIVAKIKELYKNQGIIRKVASTIQSESHKSLEAMVEDYENILKLNFTPAPLISRKVNLIERLSLMETIADLKETRHLLQQTQTELQQTQTELQQTQAKLNFAYAEIEAMKSSKFWKLREKWFKLKSWLGLANSEHE